MVELSEPSLESVMQRMPCQLLVHSDARNWKLAIPGSLQLMALQLSNLSRHFFPSSSSPPSFPGTIIVFISWDILREPWRRAWGQKEQLFLCLASFFSHDWGSWDLYIYEQNDKWHDNEAYMFNFRPSYTTPLQCNVTFSSKRCIFTTINIIVILWLWDQNKFCKAWFLSDLDWFEKMENLNSWICYEYVMLVICGNL